MTAVGIPRAVAESSAPCAQTSPFRAPPRHSRSAPSAPNFVIPRAVAESISRLPRHQPRNPVPFALPYGYCDFAQHDGCWYSEGSCRIQCPLRPNFAIPRPIPSFPKCPQRPKLRHSAPPPVIPEVPPAPQTSSFRAQSRNPFPACQGTNPGIQRPLRSPMDTATSRSMTAVGIPRAVAESSAPCAQTSPFRAPSRHSRSAPSAPNFVIPRAVAESISRLPRHQPRNPAPFALPYGYCDFAQS